MRARTILACAAALCLALPTVATAISVTASTDANALRDSLVQPGSGLVDATITAALDAPAGLPGGQRTTGTFTNATGTYDLPAAGGIVISTGDVADYGDGSDISPALTTNYASGQTGTYDPSTFANDGVAASPAQQVRLTTITGATLHFDVTEYNLTFDLQPGFDRVLIDAVFASEESAVDPTTGQPTVGLPDGVGIFVNGANVASVGGQAVTAAHPLLADVAGTELNVVLAPGGNPLITFSAIVGDGSVGNTLSIILGDAIDGNVDSTVYLANFRAAGPPTASGVPEPATLLLAPFAAAVLMSATGRKRRRAV